MASQISTLSLKKLIASTQHHTQILQQHWRNQVDWGEMTELELSLHLAECKAIEKILIAVQTQKTTHIKVEQLALFT